MLSMQDCIEYKTIGLPQKQLKGPWYITEDYEAPVSANLDSFHFQAGTMSEFPICGYDEMKKVTIPDLKDQIEFLRHKGNKFFLGKFDGFNLSWVEYNKQYEATISLNSDYLSANDITVDLSAVFERVFEDEDAQQAVFQLTKFTIDTFNGKNAE